jgi:hypothetical protein
MSARTAALLYDAPGDILSPSSLSKFTGCGAKYRFSKVDKLPDPPTGALCVGSSFHTAIGANLEQKIETKQDLPAAGVVAIYREAWAVKSAETEFRDDEMPADLKAQGEALTVKYLEESCPEIQPAAVELHVSGRIGGVLVQGFVDLLETNGRIRDYKTAARKPSEINPDYRFQVATYAQITPGATGKVQVDTLTKTKVPALVSQDFTVDQADVDQTAKMFPLVQQAIRAGMFLPNRQSNLCSRKYCAFWRACESSYGGSVGE